LDVSDMGRDPSGAAVAARRVRSTMPSSMLLTSAILAHCICATRAAMTRAQWARPQPHTCVLTSTRGVHGRIPTSMSTVDQTPSLKQFEGYWQMSSLELCAFGGDPVLELNGDGTGKIPSQFGKFRKWRVNPIDNGRASQLEVEIFDRLKEPITLRGVIVQSEYYPMVVKEGLIYRISRKTGKENPTGEFAMKKIE